MDMPPLSSKRVTGFPSTTTVWTSSLSSTITSLDWSQTLKTFPKWSEKNMKPLYTSYYYIISGMYGSWLCRHTISYHWLIYMIYTQEKQRNGHNDTPIDRCRWPCSLDTWKNECASGEPGPYLLRFIGVVITCLLHLKPTSKLLLSRRHGNTPQRQCGERNALYSIDTYFSCSTFCFGAILPIPVPAQSQKTCKDSSSYSNPNAMTGQRPRTQPCCMTHFALSILPNKLTKCQGQNL